MKISKKYIVSIEEFMSNYLNYPYTGKNKLTHKEMRIFLYEKKQKQPVSVNVNRIGKEDILKGKYLFVEDKNEKIIPYKNPMNLAILYEELSQERKKKDFEQIRNKLIEEYEKEYSEQSSEEYLGEEYKDTHKKKIKIKVNT